MHQFGEWANRVIPSAETPVGRPCLLCEKLIEAGDKGLIVPVLEGLEGPARLGVEHRECFLRSIFGQRWTELFVAPKN